jgi:hypothetical protein
MRGLTFNIITTCPVVCKAVFKMFVQEATGCEGGDSGQATTPERKGADNYMKVKCGGFLR